MCFIVKKMSVFCDFLSTKAEKNIINLVKNIFEYLIGERCKKFTNLER